MALLVHACCGPCLGGSLPALEAFTPSLNAIAYWYNPNIHPYTEYRSRLSSFLKLTVAKKLPNIIGKPEYGLNQFLSALGGDFGPARCEQCYTIRLSAAAQETKQHGCEAFTSTLLISPYQDHNKLIQIGKSVATAAGTKFYSPDLRPFFRATHTAARNFDLYRQKYCGCIFSEFDRYQNDRRFKLPIEFEKPP